MPDEGAQEEIDDLVEKIRKADERVQEAADGVAGQVKDEARWRPPRKK